MLPLHKGQEKALFGGFLGAGFVPSPSQLWEDRWVTAQPCTQPTSLLTSYLLPLLDSPDPISEGTPLPFQKQTHAIFTAWATSKVRAAVNSLLQALRLCSDVAWHRVFFGKNCIKSYKTSVGYL